MGIEERQQRRTIDGFEYIVNPLPFGIGKSALLRFTKVAAPVLASALSKDGGSAAIIAIAAGLAEEDLNYFANVFGNASWYIDGSKQVPLVTANQDRHFELRYDAFFEWLAFCIEVNFSGFFTKLLAKAGVTVSRKANLSISAEKTG